jgi:hypothetical protein
LFGCQGICGIGGSEAEFAMKKIRGKYFSCECILAILTAIFSHSSLIRQKIVKNY